MPEEIIRRKRRLSSFQIIILGFAGVILLGALLLMLPISTTGGNVTPFNETLFTATSAVCVTGLVVQDTGSYWSTFGQAVILALIQIGGLGVVTVAASFALLSGRRISLMQRSTMQDAISAPKVGGIVRLTRFILRGTFLIELLGALAVLPVFCRLRDRACGAGYRQLLVNLWAGGYSGADPNWWSWCRNRSSVVCTVVRAKNLSDAAQHHAGCNFSTKGRRNRPSDTLHPARDISD